MSMGESGGMLALDFFKLRSLAAGSDKLRTITVLLQGPLRMNTSGVRLHC
jgi:hypothetical protein